MNPKSTAQTRQLHFEEEAGQAGRVLIRDLWQTISSLEFGAVDPTSRPAQLRLDRSLRSPGTRQLSEHRCRVNDIELHFQLEPTEDQKELVHSLLDALFEKQNCLAEVPRGAGATFCTLNAVLGWLFQRSLLAPKAFVPRIFFVCRSPAKIPDVPSPHQILALCKSAVYAPSVAVLGSRDQLCVEPSLSDCSGRGRRSSAEKKRRCHELVQSAQCKFYQVSREKSSVVSETYRGKLLDLEEWAKEGACEKFCPYYSNRSLVETAQLVVLPFEALYDEAQMALLRTYTKDCIVVVEDADHLQDLALEVRTPHPARLSRALRQDAPGHAGPARRAQNLPFQRTARSALRSSRERRPVDPKLGPAGRESARRRPGLEAAGRDRGSLLSAHLDAPAAAVA